MWPKFWPLPRNRYVTTAWNLKKLQSRVLSSSIVNSLSMWFLNSPDWFKSLINIDSKRVLEPSSENLILSEIASNTNLSSKKGRKLASNKKQWRFKESVISILYKSAASPKPLILKLAIRLIMSVETSKDPMVIFYIIWVGGSMNKKKPFFAQNFVTML